MDIGLILGVLKAGLELWNTKESRKYQDRVIELEKRYFDELAKPFNNRSQLVLDNCLLELKTIARNFQQYAKRD